MSIGGRMEGLEDELTKAKDDYKKLSTKHANKLNEIEELKKEMKLLKISNDKLESAAKMAIKAAERRGLERDAAKEKLKGVAEQALKVMKLYPAGSEELRAISALVAKVLTPPTIEPCTHFAEATCEKCEPKEKA